MKFMCRTAGYTRWGLKRNEEVLKELEVEPILDYICGYQNNWREHVNRMSRTRISKAIMYYQPRGKRSLACPKKRWHEILCLDRNRPFRPRTCKEEEIWRKGVKRYGRTGMR
jgi:hypothetical protein